jgi:hypothetical protein
VNGFWNSVPVLLGRGVQLIFVENAERNGVVSPSILSPGGNRRGFLCIQKKISAGYIIYLLPLQVCVV